MNKYELVVNGKKEIIEADGIGMSESTAVLMFYAKDQKDQMDLVRGVKDWDEFKLVERGELDESNDETKEVGVSEIEVLEH